MTKKNSTSETNNEWYELWMNQSKLFFDVTNTHLKNLFTQGGNFQPQDHMKEIQDWIETLKKQGQANAFSEQLKAFPKYAEMMTQMYIQAADLLFQRWMSDNKEGQPITSIKDLYALWVDCCHEVYSKEMHSKSFQEAYGEFMNAAIHFWKSAIKG